MNKALWRPVSSRRVLLIQYLVRAIRIEWEQVVWTYLTERAKRRQNEIDGLLYDAGWQALPPEEQQRSIKEIEKRYESEQSQVDELVKSTQWQTKSDSEKKQLLDELTSGFTGSA